MKNNNNNNLIRDYNKEEVLQNEKIRGGLKKLKLIRSTPKVNNNNNKSNNNKILLILKKVFINVVEENITNSETIQNLSPNNISCDKKTKNVNATPDNDISLVNLNSKYKDPYECNFEFLTYGFFDLSYNNITNTPPTKISNDC